MEDDFEVLDAYIGYTPASGSTELGQHFDSGSPFQLLYSMFLSFLDRSEFNRIVHSS